VSVFIPRLHGTTTHAHYEVYDADGRTEVVVNQNNVYDAWVSLGTTDSTPEAAACCG